MPSDLKVASIGTPYMLVPMYSSQKFPCTQLEYAMALDEMPSVNAYLSMGRGIKSEKKVDPEAFLIWVQKFTESSRVGLIPCFVYEEKTDNTGFTSDKLIFKGYIVSGSYQYRAGTSSSRSIRIDCAGLAAPLLAAPFMAYLESTLGNIVARLEGKAEISNDEALQSGDYYEPSKVAITSYLRVNTLGRRVLEKVAMCVTAAKLCCRLTDMKSGPYVPDADVMNAFGGQLMLDVNENLGQDVEGDYTEEMFELMLDRMRSSNIFSTIKSILTSDEYALQMVPRWSCEAENDFKMELTPVTAWKPRAVLKLRAKDIKEFAMGASSVARLNVPDVVFVDFNDAISYVNGRNVSGSQYPLGIFGVACADKKLEAELRAGLINGSLMEALQKANLFKVKVINAPKWLGIVALNDEALDKASQRPDNRRDSQAESPPETLEDEQKAAGDDAAYSILTNAAAMRSARACADILATVLFLYYYRADDTARLSLTPDIRFGRDGRFFENHIGDTVEINLDDDMVASNVKVRGVIRAVTYTFMSGEGSMASYQLVLERVRLLVLTADEPQVACPIYKFGTSSGQTANGNVSDAYKNAIDEAGAVLDRAFKQVLQDEADAAANAWNSPLG